ncbi:hypothetical protein AKH48_25460 [Salmonella enterica]|nr:hypothetical protein [Salmonella enterica subsp. enterica serovar Bispebjerg]EAA3641810.1 hypothetical protein [Salmonella enterica subsp. enterica serovar Hessarek]EAA5958519.1 hypothetical protein [Salmonella enterica subsp. enterica serovar Stanleyville]EAA7278987.1 hypothetical protein [Salmonella enterica]EAW1213346.1 hypothetical protein [Salmonella enterica subsp. enterica]EBV5751523.1 hypothetical protein [Salmonella enterica subsp. enterica serovar Inverness]
MYIAQILRKKHCLYIHSNYHNHQQLRGLTRFINGVMGCRGSEVQILSCRPKFPLKASLPGLVFLYIQFANGEMMVK